MEYDPPFELPLDRSKPLHDPLWDLTQYRVKLQRYTTSPAEMTVQKISFERDWQRYQNAYHAGRSSCFPLRRRRDPSEERDAESIERCQRRAKIQVRKLVTELAPNHFVTFTTREAGPDYFTPADWSVMWAHFVRLVRHAGLDFEYLAVLERHPSNPQHLHLHVAWRGHAHYNLLRRFWHMAICAHKGVKITKMMRGVDAPGNIQDRPVKAPRGSFRQVAKIAKYISKYITKDLISEFNKKRYWLSKGLTLIAAKVFWLQSFDVADAIKEAAGLAGAISSDGALLLEQMFFPSDRIFWARLDSERIAAPPF